MTLEWLLIIGAIAGLAAVSVLAVQNVIDDSTDLPPRPDIRIIDAEIQAAQVASDANADIEANPGSYSDATYSGRCNQVASRFSDVVSTTPTWTLPIYSGGTFTQRAQCVLTRLP